jgi:phosphoribosyl 1,2-cyclic phosphate phosphodiesterase
VPVIGCRCRVCTSDDPRNRRLRTGLWIEAGGVGTGGVGTGGVGTGGVGVDGVGKYGIDGGGASILIDASADLRQQALAAGIERVDAVLFTHAHADHIYGLDDLRVFNFRQGEPIPCFGPAEALAAIRRAFSYVFDGSEPEGGGKPQLALVPVRAPFEAAGLPVTPVPVWHGSLEVFGYRIGGLGYVTDCKRIPEASLALLEGVEVLVLNALRYRPHPTHLSIAEALAIAERLGPRRTVFTHITHDVDHATPEVALPDGVELGYDGLVLEV